MLIPFRLGARDGSEFEYKLCCWVWFAKNYENNWGIGSRRIVVLIDNRVTHNCIVEKLVEELKNPIKSAKLVLGDDRMDNHPTEFSSLLIKGS